jgi:MFS family permease
MEQVQWVTTVYLIIVSSIMLLVGRVGDQVGTHRVYLIGVSVFTVGSALCCFCDDIVALLASRALQAFGAAMMMGTGVGIITLAFPANKRGMALGVNILMVGLGSILGPVISGLLLSFTTWHALFLVSVPLGMLSLICGLIWLRSPSKPRIDVRSLDLPGSALLILMITAFILAIGGGFEGSQWFFLPLCALVPIFLLVERRMDTPIIEMALLRNDRFIFGNLITFFSYAGYMAVNFQLPFFLETVWLLPVGTAGLLMTIAAIGTSIAGPLAGIVSDRIGAMRLMPVALAVVILSYLVAMLFESQVSWVLAASCMALVGVGMAMLNSPNNAEIMTAAGKKFAGYAGSFVGTNRNLAFCIGTALSAGLFPMLHERFGLSLAADDAYLGAFRCIVAIAVALTSVSLLVWWVLHRRLRLAVRNDDAEERE